MKTGKKFIVASLVLLAFVFTIFRLTSSHARDEIPASPTATAPAVASAPDLKDIRDYKTWTRVHTTPQPLPAPLDAMCRMPTLRDRVETSMNPHRRKFFTVYVNEIGRQAMMSEIKPAFPEGSIIVKEKLLAKDSPAPELLTVMVKREKGFNQESGDWEYMVVDGEQTKIEGRGKLANCQSCHAVMNETDYVFRSYLPDDVRQKLR
jgi:Cytochrome P460